MPVSVWSCTAVTVIVAAYVEQLLAISGLQSKIIQAELRMEAGAPVQGLVVCATKSV